MAKKKGAQEVIKLVSVEGPNKGKSVYWTRKNKKKTPEKLEKMKYCKFTRKHVLHKESK